MGAPPILTTTEGKRLGFPESTIRMTIYEPSIVRRRPFGPSLWFDCLKFATLMAILIWLLAEGSERLGYHWQWYRVPRYLFVLKDGAFLMGPLLQGLMVTFQITGISLLLAFVFGLTTALLRLSPSFMGRMLSRAYVESIRNTPLLVQLFFIYFVLSPVLGINRFTSAVLALSLFEGAYA